VVLVFVVSVLAVMVLVWWIRMVLGDAVLVRICQTPTVKPPMPLPGPALTPHQLLGALVAPPLTLNTWLALCAVFW
jgi:hypothetical protein